MSRRVWKAAAAVGAYFAALALLSMAVVACLRPVSAAAVIATVGGAFLVGFAVTVLVGATSTEPADPHQPKRGGR